MSLGGYIISRFNALLNPCGVIERELEGREAGLRALIKFNGSELAIQQTREEIEELKKALEACEMKHPPRRWGRLR